MIRSLLLILSISLLALACSDSEESNQEQDVTTEEPKLQDNFTIIGEIQGAPNTTFYLEAQSQRGVINVSQATSDANGNFKMRGNIAGMGLYQLRMGQSNEKSLLLTLVPEDELTIKATSDTYEKSPQAEGTKWAQTMADYMVVVDKFRTDQKALMNATNLSQEQMQARMLTIQASIENFAIEAMKKDPSNPYNIVLSTYAVPNSSFNDWDPERLDLLNAVSAAFAMEYADSPFSEMLANQVVQIETAYNQYLMNNSGNYEAPEIALKNPDDQLIKLSSLRGKYVLIDFWASWCGPCRKESPNVVRLYNKYKDKGFTVYSVSLDNNKEHWMAAIEKDGLVWPNHVSDLLQWNSPMPKLYGFSGIPYTVLLNKEGKIIGTGLRGEELEQKLKELFEK